MTRWFAQPFVKMQIKKNIKVPRLAYWGAKNGDSVSRHGFCVGRHIKLWWTGGSIRNSEEFSNWKTLGGLPHQTSDTCSHSSSSREGGDYLSSQMVPNKNVAILFCCWASKLCEIPDVALWRVPEWSGRGVSVLVHGRPSCLLTQIWQLECCVLTSVWGTDLHTSG